MVDINLIGDDQAQYDGEEKDKDYQSSFDSDVGEPESGSFMGDSGMDGSEYSNYMNRGGSKKVVYILIAGCVILLFIVGYFLFFSGKEEEPDSAQYLSDQAVEDTTEMTTLGNEPIGLSSLSPALREKMTRFQKGVNTVSNIMTTVPEAVNFTMISYNDGKILVEFLANNDNAIDNVNSNLKEKLYASEMKIISRDRRNIMGRPLRQALMNGNVSVGDGSGDYSALQEPNYLSAEELKNQFSQLCGQSGLKLRQFDAGKKKIDGEFEIIPIKFRAVGKKSNILDFLQQAVSENANINFSKISLIANDVNLNDLNLTLVLNIELYQML